MRHLAIGVCVFTAACSGTTATGPSAVGAPVAALSAASGASAAGVQPHFNLEAILRGDGFGLVSLRQHKDPAQNVLYMDVWVRDLLPNASYDLQRAADSPRDGICTGTNWLTMGQGATPQPILTNDRGTGRAELWRAVPGTAGPSDIHFRVVRTGTSDAVLRSDCYPLLLRD
jgi:hypothetical protein